MVLNTLIQSLDSIFMNMASFIKAHALLHHNKMELQKEKIIICQKLLNPLCPRQMFSNIFGGSHSQCIILDKQNAHQSILQYQTPIEVLKNCYPNIQLVSSLPPKLLVAAFLSTLMLKTERNQIQEPSNVFSQDILQPKKVINVTTHQLQ